MELCAQEPTFIRGIRHAGDFSNSSRSSRVLRPIAYGDRRRADASVDPAGAAVIRPKGITLHQRPMGAITVLVDPIRLRCRRP